MHLAPPRARPRRTKTLLLAAVASLALTGLVLPGTVPNAAAASCGTTNLALNQTATASSIQNASFPAQDAVDGNLGTRWSSAFSDPQWLEVDLGSTQSICQVVLNWDNAYATAFQIQTSPDGTTWTSIYSTTTGTGGTQTLSVTGSGRYIRMYGTTRATPTATACGNSRSTDPQAAAGPAAPASRTPPTSDRTSTSSTPACPARASRPR